MKHFCEKIKQNRGSAMIMVILAIVFLTAFGTLAMTMSYTSLETSIAERHGKEAGYTAESAMEQVRCGIQNAASEAMSKTYNKVFRDYTYNAGNIKIEFQTSFVDFFEAYKVGGESTGEKLVLESGGNLFYGPSILEGMIEEERGGVATVYTGGSRAILFNDETQTYTFKDIRIDYISPKGRKSSVTADIKVRIPDIGYTLTQYALSGIPEHCLIVKGTLFQGEADKKIQLRGEAYCGNVVLSNNSQFTTSNNMTFVIGNTFSVMNSQIGAPRFSQGANTTMWAKNIEIGSSTNVEFKGKTYVRNDLKIQGSDSRVRISGEYVGFGTGYENPQTANPTDPKLAAYSSSIIVNGMRNVLDLAGSSLTLGGVSFVGNQIEGLDGFNPENAVPMGESVSVKSNQKPFLVPEGHLERRAYIMGFDSAEGKVYFEATVITNVGGEPFTHLYARAYKDEIGNYTFKIPVLDGENNEIWVPLTEEVTEFTPKLKDPIPVTSSIEYLTDYEAGPGPYNEANSYKLLDDKDCLAFYQIKGETWEWVFENGSYKWKLTGNSNVKVKGLEKAYSEYTISLKPVSVRLTDGHTVVYLFMNFEDDVKRSEFFEDYFMANPAVISSYVKKHIDNEAYYVLKKPSYIPPNSLDAVGIAMGMPDFETSSSGVFEWNLPNDPSKTGDFYMERGVVSTITTMCDFMLSVFDNFRKTLSNTEKDGVTDDTNPYDFHVREQYIIGDEDAGIEGLFPPHVDGKMYFYVGNEEKPKGLIVKGNFTYDLSEPLNEGLRIIIVTGDAIMGADYEGLIFVGGDLIVNENVKFSRDAFGVVNAFDADNLPSKEAIGDYRIKYFLAGDILTQYTEEDSNAGEAWNIEKLVSYSKWKKN